MKKKTEIHPFDMAVSKLIDEFVTEHIDDRIEELENDVRQLRRQVTELQSAR